MTQHARITGKVEYREGEGQSIPIRPGPIDFEETAIDVTLSWEDGDTRGAAAMPKSEFKRYVAEHAIELLD
jgi:hypothetical protein